MVKDELSLREKEVLQEHFGNADFFNAMDHWLSIERDAWDRRMKNAAVAGAEAKEPIQRLLVINEAAAKASVWETFFLSLSNRAGVKLTA
jgi:hypothetical protein